MHEQSLMADMMRKILSVSLMHGGSKVAGIKVKLGALAHISPEHFMEHFVEAAKNTVAEDARVDIEVETDTTDPRAQDIWIETVELEEE
ncbi:MAG: hydrogenase maturation nickel metallochaperone HypA [Nitrospinaceae bacterium]|nr:hydrogenase maturation nickel metallochaperone HypA [Nitrospinaceae bacterium]NIR56435.1 hydrogenase maturation nickel metallochaperone HypA [Nitrospinaceae bacterium]NIS86897.1 hydrogenase maturation nickel metallochaperone HypA [Nitrospinaceae bacterium]NIT83734.1 hydrogenase maturation nickel metallochaperone HypA [Nitrospinaceae bacterium]NIU45938.1 hydrogenase maturation nickel metallochaperone HypA [Nitrospinaceae bacterium]